MSRVSFDTLPNDARIWVFGASEPITGAAESALLSAVDGWLDGWQAHGQPLVCGRDWRDSQFLVIGVDQRTAGASGCSVDALFRVLRDLETSHGASLLGGGRVFYRDSTSGRGAIRCVDRASFVRLGREQAVGSDTTVFDTAITDAGTYRAFFEKPLAESWHAALVARPAASRSAT